jgi:hypothetical protein
MRRALILAALASGLAAAPARAATFTVTRLDDPANATCVQTTCDSLRAAIAAANANAKDADTIQLGAATYTLQQATELAIGSPVTITGVSARRTLVHGNGTTRVLSVTNGPVTLQQLTVEGGREATTGEFGGNILKTGPALTLTRVRITDGQAQAGGGIANRGGPLNITDSLIDDNSAVLAGAASGGGGIYNAEAPATSTAVPGVVNITNSTLAFNAASASGGRAATAHGGGIFNTLGNTVTLQGVTVARNTVTTPTTTTQPGGGIFDSTTDGNAGISSSASIVASNLVNGTEANCGHTRPLPQPTPSLEGPPGDCGFSRAADPQLATALSNQGGYTDVLAIASTSPAKGLATTCPVLNDQRDAPRSAPCDAGAFEEGATALVIDPIDSGPAPQPQPQPGPTPTPAPTATPTPPPAPIFHKQVVIKPVSGKVRVKLAGTKTFIDLASAADIPLGSTIDVKHGKLQLSSVPKANGKPQTATFFGGIFKVTQPGGTTDLKLNESLASCAKAHAAKAKKKPKSRHLWGSGHGAFRTSGQYSAATVRGTEWLVQDSCSGTLTRVKHGVVNVRDNVRHKTIVVRAGHRYLAKPKH